MMDETIEKAVREVADRLSHYPLPEQAFMLREIADGLYALSGECVKMEYGITGEDTGE